MSLISNNSGNILKLCLTAGFAIYLLVAPLHAQPTAPSFSYDNQLDLNNAAFEDISRLPVTRDVAEKIFQRIQFSGPFSSVFQLRDIEGIGQELFLSLKPMIRIEPFAPISERESRLAQLYFRLDRWGGDEGTNQALIDSWIERSLDPVNVNQLRYDELLNLQGVSPVDAAAIVTYRNRVGDITSLRDLRAAPYLSWFGYRNTRNFVTFEQSAPRKQFHGSLLFRMSNTPFQTEEADVTDAGAINRPNIGANDYPDVYTRLIGSYGPDIKVGVSYWHALGEPVLHNDLGFMQVPKSKFYVGLENQRLGPVDMRKLYVGNYSLAFGQGIIMENSDFFNPRKTGFGFRKRFIGLTGDNSRTRQYKLTGAAAEFALNNAHLTLFGAFDKRDAILNRQPILFNGQEIHPVNQLIVLDQRFEFAPLDENRQDANLPWRETVKELLYGFHGAYDILPTTQVGFTYYESAYDRPLRPNLAEIVDPDALSQVTFTDNEILNSYGGSISDGENPIWSDAKSFRRLYGMDLQAVFQNFSFQAEYAELDKGQSPGLFGKDGNPWAFVANAYLQYNSFNLMALYRNYQLGFDNPYQRSFSNYRRFKRTIYEDFFNLQDGFYFQLYSNNPQPQNERGFYLNTRYQMSRKLTLGAEYDNWKRNADNVTQYRLRATLQYRPVFPIIIELRQKWQGRSPQNDRSLEYFDNLEFRGRLRFRLSRFNELSLLYMNSKVIFHPRPRLSFPTEPTAPGEEFQETNFAGTASLPGSALGAAYTHNFNEWLKVRGYLGYYNGFFWNFEDTQFFVTESQRGATRFWFSVYSRISNQLSMRIKYTRDHQYPLTFVEARDSQNTPIGPTNDGRQYSGNLVQPNDEFYYMEFNWHF